jgi:hypothetical protein
MSVDVNGKIKISGVYVEMASLKAKLRAIFENKNTTSHKDLINICPP